MPQVGETRTYNGETRTWSGTRWEAASAPAQTAPDGSVLGRFFGGAMETSPLNPMNLVRAIASPGETVAGLIRDPLANLFKVPGDIKAAVTGERGDRLSAGAEALAHIGGSVPFIGPAGTKAGQKIGEGDIAGGAGELAGLASGALVPKIAGRAPKAMQTVGRGVESAGNFLKNKGSVNIGGVHIPIGSAIGLAEAAAGHGPLGLATAAAPYALEYGGKGVSAAGEALGRLRDSGTPETVNRFKKLRPNAEVPYKMPSDMPAYEGKLPDPPLSPIEEFYRDNPMGEGRMTGAPEVDYTTGKPGGLAALADLSRARNARASAVMADMEKGYGHSRSAHIQDPRPLWDPESAPRSPELWEADVPEFSFEGEANAHPGEFPPGPAVEGFDVGEPIGEAPLRTKYLEQLMASPSFAGLARLGKR